MICDPLFSVCEPCQRPLCTTLLQYIPYNRRFLTVTRKQPYEQNNKSDMKCTMQKYMRDIPLGLLQLFFCYFHRSLNHQWSFLFHLLFPVGHVKRAHKYLCIKFTYR